MIRDERAGDEAAIERVIVGAFAKHPHSCQNEHLIARQLRLVEAMSVSLVSLDANGEIDGHLAFSEVTVDGRRCGWYGLGPLAVRPDRQKTGIGSALMRHGLAELDRKGACGCVVLGDPDFYQRFGFAANNKLVLTGMPPEYFLLLAMRGEIPGGIVRYHEAFAI
ncbi:MAG: N-acetyltransferase [Verrucomicrobiales bacterium]|jgi:predicted N-acetyltransferase YhbS|nr:N-acetyltransferase [Verrucomicrobiales bacterium]